MTYSAGPRRATVVADAEDRAVADIRARHPRAEGEGAGVFSR